MQIDELRRRMAAERQGRVFPEELRRAALDHGQMRRAAGIRWKVIADELGVHEQTIRFWQKKHGRGPRVGAVARVAIEPERAAATTELVVEYGAVRVRGLDVPGVAELLRRLT